MTLQLALPRFPDPPVRFDRENEAQFRRALERAILDIQQAAATSTATGGASVAGEYNFSTTTTAADPGTKKFRMNNATLASVTALYLNDNTVGGFDISTLASFLASGNRIYVQQKTDATKAALFEVSGAPTDNTGWWTIPVTVVDSGTLPDNNATCSFVFVFSSGTMALTSLTDVNITTPAAGAALTYDSGTAKWIDGIVPAPLASPAFTGTPTAPTASTGDNDTSIATTAFVQQEIAAQDFGGYGSEHAGTTDLTVYYGANFTGGQALSTIVMGTAGLIRLMPFVAPARGGTLDRLAFEVSAVGAASAVMRIGLYDSKGVNNIFPNNLLETSGDIDTTSGGGAAPVVKTYTVSRNLTAGRVYWLAVCSNGVSTTIRAILTSAVGPILGHSGGTSTGALASMMTVDADSVGVLNATGAGAVRLSGTNPPLLLYRLSS